MFIIEEKYSGDCVCNYYELFVYVFFLLFDQ